MSGRDVKDFGVDPHLIFAVLVPLLQTGAMITDQQATLFTSSPLSQPCRWHDSLLVGCRKPAYAKTPAWGELSLLVPVLGSFEKDE